MSWNRQKCRNIVAQNCFSEFSQRGRVDTMTFITSGSNNKTVVSTHQCTIDQYASVNHENMYPVVKLSPFQCRISPISKRYDNSILKLRKFVRSYDKTDYRILKRATGLRPLWDEACIRDTCIWPTNHWSIIQTVSSVDQNIFMKNTIKRNRTGNTPYWIRVFHLTIFYRVSYGCPGPVIGWYVWYVWCLLQVQSLDSAKLKNWVLYNTTIYCIVI